MQVMARASAYEHYKDEKYGALTDLRVLLLHGKAPFLTVDAVERQLQRCSGAAAAAGVWHDVVKEVINEPDCHISCIHLAIMSGDVGVVSFLLKHGADILWNYTRSGLNAVQYAALYASPVMCDLIFGAVPVDMARPWLFDTIVVTEAHDDFFGMLACDFECEYSPCNFADHGRQQTREERVVVMHKLLDRIARLVPPGWPRDWLLRSATTAHDSGNDVIPQAVAALRTRHAMQAMRPTSCRWLQGYKLLAAAAHRE
jgi:hypothetical protein